MYHEIDLIQQASMVVKQSDTKEVDQLLKEVEGQTEEQ
jgi:hypothetical protein